MNPHILIIGSGSAGKRHAQNLATLGCRISAFDPREDRLAEIHQKTKCVHTSSSLDEVLTKDIFNGAVIASPPVFHIAQGIKLIQKGIPIRPRKVQSSEMVIKACLSKGTLRIKPTAEKAKIVQANIKPATITVPIGASKVPCCADSIIG